MPKTLYQGYRVSKEGGSRWTGTLARTTKPTQPAASPPKAPTGGSAFANNSTPSRDSQNAKAK